MEYLTLSEIHEEGLKLLLSFDNFCKENNIRYSLTAGTLLGAVRHKEFIPWDDDIDVSMPRPDYDRLLSMGGDEIPAPFKLMTRDNSEFAYQFAKFVTTTIRTEEPASRGKFDSYLWVDIFPMDGLSEDASVRDKRYKKILRVFRKRAYMKLNHSAMHQPWYKKLPKLVFQAVHDETYVDKMDKRFDDYLALSPYDASDYIGSMSGGSTRIVAFDKKQYEDFTEMELYGYKFPVMGCWEEYLREYYGNYMELPPIDQRGSSHHLLAWRADESE